MSRTLKLTVAVSAIGLWVLASQVLPGADQSPENPGARRPRGDAAPLKRAILKKEDVSAEEKILNALDKPTTVEMVELPLEDCLTFLQDYHGINIWIDRQTLTDEGVALDAPVSLKLADAKLESILNLILGPFQLDWVIQDEVLKITTRASAQQHPEVRTHSVQSLLDAGHTPEELIDSITKCIEPELWTKPEGIAGISHTGGVLVVRASQRIQSEIVQLLAELEEIADETENDPARLERDKVVSVKVYPTGDQPAERLAQLLPDLVATATWGAQGGGVHALDRVLVVRQMAAVHRSIQKLLTQIDAKRPPAPAAEATSPPTAPSAGGDPFGVLTSSPAAPRGAESSRLSREESAQAITAS